MKERIVVAGLGFGDEGKGSIVDHLVREHRADAVVRYNGGAQAGHRVVCPDGREHVFAQFGSGTFVPGVETYLSKHVIVNPLNLFREHEHLLDVGINDALDRLFIDPGALLATPFHVAANRLRELARGDDRHGSCGQGIGEARSDELNRWKTSVRASDLFFDEDLLRKLRHVQASKREHADWLLHDGRSLADGDDPAWLDRRWDEESRVLYDPGVPERLVEWYADLRRCVCDAWSDRLRDYRSIVFEGAQGILLDETHGFHPHVTWTRTTSGNAHDLLDDAGYDGPRRTIGVTRCYSTRHGAGPLPTEDAKMTRKLPDPTNQTDPWQGRFRVGALNLNLLHYALSVDSRVGEIAVTCLDRRPDPTPYVPSYVEPIEREHFLSAKHQTQMFKGTDDGFVEYLENALGLPVTIRSYGPTALDKR